MKRVLFVMFALVFMVSFAFAQNEATVTQTGSNNDAKATQTGENEAYVNQIGNWHEATVAQIGENYGAVLQLNGNYNDADLTQVGIGNSARIIQGMKSNFWNNYRQLGASYNEASVTQTGNRNFGLLSQYGGTNVNNANEASITQEGDDNAAYAYQGWNYTAWGETYTTSTLQSYNSSINISQKNNDNFAAAWQYGGNRNQADIDQFGYGNFASIAQGFIYADANYTFSRVFNTKDNNAKITQSGDDNIAKLFQLGDNNSFKLAQSHGSSVGYDVEATGLENLRNAYFYQDGDNNQFAGVWKSGDDISFWAAQDAEQLNGAELEAWEEGIEGYYGSFQQGNSNIIGLRQFNDWALIQQLGNNNEAVLWQQDSGAVHEATILQNGNSNTANLLQQL